MIWNLQQKNMWNGKKIQKKKKNMDVEEKIKMIVDE